MKINRRSFMKMLGAGALGALGALSKTKEPYTIGCDVAIGESQVIGIMGAIKGNPGKLQAYCKEAMLKGHFVVIEQVDDFGNIWVVPVKDFYKT